MWLGTEATATAGAMADEDQERRHQEAAADANMPETNPTAAPIARSRKTFDRDIGDGKEKLHARLPSAGGRMALAALNRCGADRAPRPCLAENIVRGVKESGIGRRGHGAVTAGDAVNCADQRPRLGGGGSAGRRFGRGLSPARCPSACRRAVEVAQQAAARR